MFAGESLWSWTRKQNIRGSNSIRLYLDIFLIQQRLRENGVKSADGTIIHWDLILLFYCETFAVCCCGNIGMLFSACGSAFSRPSAQKDTPVLSMPSSSLKQNRESKETAGVQTGAGNSPKDTVKEWWFYYSNKKNKQQTHKECVVTLEQTQIKHARNGKKLKLKQRKQLNLAVRRSALVISGDL